MIRNYFRIFTNRILGLGVPNKFRSNWSTLVHELIETMLSICTWLSKDNWASFYSTKANSFYRNTFAITLHLKLLDVGWES